MKKWPGIVVLILGGLIIGAGFGGAWYLESEVEKQIPNAIEQLKDNITPETQAGVFGQTMDTLLEGIIDGIEDMGTTVPQFVNASTTSQMLNGTLSGLVSGLAISLAAAENLLINDNNFQATYSAPFKGFNETIGIPSADYSAAASNLLSGVSLAGLPGLAMNDIGDGTPGTLAWLAIYADPNGATAGALPNKGAMAAAYGLSTETELDYVAGWVTGELFNTVPAIIGDVCDFTVPACTSATEEFYIKLQWANKTLIPDGMNSFDSEIPPFEIGSSEFISQAQVESLWDAVSEGSSYTSDEASDIDVDPAISATLYAEFMAWIDAFEVVVQAGAGPLLGITATGDDFYLAMMYIQWDHLGATGEPLDLGDGLTGFELNDTKGLTTQISETTLFDLWNENSTDSFANDEGVQKWLDASKGTGDNYNGLMSTIGLNEAQMEAITDWVLWIRDDLIPAAAGESDVPGFVYAIWETDTTQAKKDIQLWLPVGGGVLALLGIGLLIGSKKK